jgi:hypothetical protein
LYAAILACGAPPLAVPLACPNSFAPAMQRFFFFLTWIKTIVEGNLNDRASTLNYITTTTTTENKLTFVL